ncbi:MAG: DNA-directed DNA polymerase II small subunit [Nanoarchaeota archaeon]|nr:DNA-directed DNA polymerase II small subunit [Nanoarchaeota archaeon]MBU4352164.1 DNA-directed DNA polymerase II small subunit [Nanoarchaeota archaeon]
MSAEDKAKIVSTLMSMNFFLTPETIYEIPNNISYEFFYEHIFNKIEKKEIPISITKDEIINLFKLEKKQIIENKINIKIINSYDKLSKKRDVQHFVKYFKARYETLKKILQNRVELQDAISIRRLSGNNDREKISLIGLVLEKNVTKNGNIALTIEDPTGILKTIITKNKKDSFDIAKDITLDEVIGLVGNYNGQIMFINEIILPDLPSRPYKKCPDNVAAAFISDLHVGSNMFLPEDFMKFIKWLKGDTGTDEQKEIAKSIKYLFIAGDLVDGIGIYPGQEEELVIFDIIAQYNKCAEYLSMIRKDVQIILCAGNHDAVRIAEPQPKLDKRFTQALYDLSNVTIVSNPSVINIHSSEKFPGFDVLMYHGFSFDYYIANISSLRNNGGYDRGDLLMKMLLQKRHLAPTHTSTLYIPDEEEDPLVINNNPDFFITGHIHKLAISNYKSTTMICCSCWQDKTSFQEKVGHNPEPGRVPIVNLKTREIKIMRFSD